VIAFGAILLLAGCSRERYYRQADQEAKSLVAEKSNDPRWATPPDFNIDMDPRSRFYDPCDQVRPPMPQDDPAAHEYMHCVDGMKGSKKWHANGDRCGLENPDWRQRLREYAELTPEGRLQLKLDSAVRIARINSPEYQSMLEELYLSALDVSTERFRFDVQFSGHNETSLTHLGRLHSGGETNTLRTDTTLEASRRFAAAGELLAGFANSFIWQFAGPDQYSTFSILDFSLVQPLLRGAGREVALEQLTITERALLDNLRSMQRYRQGFFTWIAVGDMSGDGPARRGGFFGGTGLTGFTGSGLGGYGGVGMSYSSGSGFAGGGAGTVGGFVGLLQVRQQIRNTEETLGSQLRALNLLEAHLEAGTIDLTQVDQFRQSIEASRAELLQARNGLENSLDNYKTSVLGLPPSIPIDLDDSFIRPFQFIDPALSAVKNQLADFLDQFGCEPLEPEIAVLHQGLAAVAGLGTLVERQFTCVAADIQKAQAAAPSRQATMSAVEYRFLIRDLEALAANFQKLQQQLGQVAPRLAQLRQKLSPETRRATADQLVELVSDLASTIDELSLVQARARVEAISVSHEKLAPEEALDIARANRLDWMNARASLVDTWRLIAYKANALQSDLGVVFSGDMSTTGNNPMRFRAPTGSLRVGLQFDPPFTRLLERNDFRQSLIYYQRHRRQMIQYEDGISKSLRALLRDMEQLQVNLEIQRRAVAIAIRRADQTREVINQPPPPPAPGQPKAQLGETTAVNLLTALSDLRRTQDAFMSVWLNYYALRMRLARELGLMELDPCGMWIEQPLTTAQRASPEEVALPPPLPEPLLQELEKSEVDRDPGATEPPVPAPRPPAEAVPPRDTAPTPPETPVSQPAADAILPPSAQRDGLKPSSGG
jgi:hypothetical protein